MATTIASLAPLAPSGKRMGLTIASYWHRWGGRSKATGSIPKWRDALEVMEHCATLGGGGLQIGCGGWDSEFAKRFRARREALGLYFEGQVGLPKSEADVEKFDRAIRESKEQGATVVRAVCLGGRRYETFSTAKEWTNFSAQSWNSLTLAEPVVRHHGVRLAVENHKDWRVEEQLALLRRLGQAIEKAVMADQAYLNAWLLLIEACSPGERRSKEIQDLTELCQKRVDHERMVECELAGALYLHLKGRAFAL